MIVQNASTVAAVSAQIRSIMEKKNDNILIEDMQDILNKRLRSLVSNSIVIHLPDSSRMSADNYRVLLDNCFRYAKTMINYGVVFTDNLLENLEGNDWEDNHLGHCCGYAIRHALKDKDWMPTLSITGSLQLSLSLLITFFSSGGMISLDQHS